jgi:hypothetical protein
MDRLLGQHRGSSSSTGGAGKAHAGGVLSEWSAAARRVNVALDSNGYPKRPTQIDFLAVQPTQPALEPDRLVGQDAAGPKFLVRCSSL